MVHLAKLLQLLGLIISGGALIIGIQSDSPRLELELLAASASLFLAGTLMLKIVGRGK